MDFQTLFKLILIATTLDIPGGWSLTIDMAKCSGAVGLQSGSVSDSQLSASSAFDQISVGPQNARLNSDLQGGAWCPRSQIDPDTLEWIQLRPQKGQIYLVTAIATQGRFGQGLGVEYAENYKILYQGNNREDIGDRWSVYRMRNGTELVTGNNDTSTVVKYTFERPFLASAIRIQPYSALKRTVCLRFEIYGCILPSKPAQNDLPPKSDIRNKATFSQVTRPTMIHYAKPIGTMPEMSDWPFEGKNYEKRGLLYDGVTGGKWPPSMEEGLWLGWNRNENPNGIILRIWFDQPMNISSVSIFCSNQFTIGAKLFEKAEIKFSIDGRRYQKDPSRFSFANDTDSEHSRWVQMSLSPSKSAILLQITLYLPTSAEKLLLSELSVEADEIPIDSIEWPLLAETNEVSSEWQENVLPTLLTMDITQSQSGSGTTEGSQISAVTYMNVNSDGFGTIDNFLWIFGVSLIGILLISFAAICILSRYRRLSKEARATAAAYADAYAGALAQCAAVENAKFATSNGENASGVTTMDTSGKLVRVYVDAKSVAATMPMAQNKVGRGKHTKMSESTYIMRADNERNALLEDEFQKQRLPTMPCPTSPPPAYRSRPGSSDQCSTISPLSHITKSTAMPVSSGAMSHSTFLSNHSHAGTMILPVDEDGSEYAEPDLVLPAGDLSQPSSSSSDSNEYSNTTDEEHVEDAYCDYDYASASNSPFSLIATDGQAASIPRIDSKQLEFVEKLGEGNFGEVHLCSLSPIACSSTEKTPVLVAVKLLRPNASPPTSSDFAGELARQSRLKHPNVVRVLGACGSGSEKPWAMIVEWMKCGDLNQYCRQKGDFLSTPELLQMGRDIAKGMAYLESIGFVHRDLAARNCLVDEINSSSKNNGTRKRRIVKIADFGMARRLYSADYYRVEGSAVLPIRWMAWECVLVGKFTSRSDAWSWAVTLWELMTLCREQPFGHMADADVVQNLQFMCHHGGLRTYLPRPEQHCSEDLYKLLMKCWSKNDMDRPNFASILQFFDRNGGQVTRSDK